MKSVSWLFKKVVVPGLGLLAVLLGLYCWWHARLEARVDLSRKLVGRWVAEGQTNRLAAGAPAQVTGGVTRGPGRAGTALAFDGATARVSVPDAPELALGAGQDFSVMAWIQPVQADTSFGVMSIVEKRKVGGIATARGFSLHLEYGYLACQISPAPGFHLTKANLLAPKTWPALWKARHALAAVRRFISQGPNLFDGRFHHVALTLKRNSPTGGKLYVDGNVVHTFDPTTLGGSLANSEPLLIGTHPDQTLRCGFQGRIEDVRLYSRALSLAEIEAAANP